ncbi:hypothetical protein [Streptomyces sp. Da 82-17]|uniref:hypothetical protein n=1 Tax=Streptomyces sp. Da 82-17 TaxID=3377116 RepID=UPI0038D4DC30
MYAQVQVANANKEFSDAVTEAKGIHAVLQDAYDEQRDLAGAADGPRWPITGGPRTPAQRMARRNT